MTVPQDLIERVRKATGPDRELDDAIMALFYNREERHIGAWLENDFGPDEPVKDLVWVDPKSDKWVSTHAIDFTTSVDAALALAERVLPGWDYELTGMRSHGYIAILWAEGYRDDWQGITRSEAPTAPLAIVLALLTALQSSEQSK